MGVAHFSQATIPVMKVQGSGCIINTSSLAVAFLASDAAGYMTGVPTVIAGGLSVGL